MAWYIFLILPSFGGKCSGMVHWDDLEVWDGEGGGRRAQDGEHM